MHGVSVRSCFLRNGKIFDGVNFLQDLYIGNPGFANPNYFLGFRALIHCTGFQEFITTRGGGRCRGGSRQGGHGAFEIQDESGNARGDSLIFGAAKSPLSVESNESNKQFSTGCRNKSVGDEF